MVSADLVNYFKDGTLRGESVVDLKNNLLSNGWSSAEVEEAFAVSRGNSGHSLVSSFGKARIFIGFGLFVFVLFIVFIVVMSSSEKVDIVLNESDLLQGQTVNVGINLVEIRFDQVKSETLRALDIGVISTVVDIAGEKRKFLQDENNTIDLDLDGKKDIMIRLIEIKNNSPIFYMKLLEKDTLVDPESVDKEVIDKALKKGN